MELNTKLNRNNQPSQDRNLCSNNNCTNKHRSIFAATASIDGSHFVIARVSESVTPQQEA